MFKLASDIVTGGWNAINNIGAAAGQGMAAIGSTFFPAPQRTQVEHLPLEPAGGTGETYRAIDQENKSMIDTFSYFMNDWKNSPYEMQYSTAPKIAESQALSDSVSVKKQDWIGQGLDWALGTAQKFETIVGSWDRAMGKQPTAVNTEGMDHKPGTRTVTEQGSFAKRGADILESFKAAAGNVLNQAKGLFNLGFGGTGDGSPVFSIQHELDPGTKIAIGSTGLIIIVVLAILLFRGKK